MHRPLLRSSKAITGVLLLGCSILAANSQAPTGAYDIRYFGAAAGGKTKCTQAIAKAIAAATAKGGGTIYIPAGTFLTGPIHLQSHITLYLDSGAILKFSDNFDDYLPMVPSRWEGIEVTNFSPFIYAHGAENIAIRGRGTLDGQGKAWWEQWGRVRSGEQKGQNKWQKEFTRLNAKALEPGGYGGLQKAFLRPPFIQPNSCTNVLIEGVTIINSPFWTVSPLYCENVTVDAVTIRNPISPNTDGINPDSCHNVHISNCDISVGDDCITIKSGRDADGRRVGRPAENYTIQNCTMARGHGGVVIGSEMSGGVRNITIANCIFDGTERGIRIKSARGRGGVVEDIRVSNIVMRSIEREAVILTTFYEKSQPEPVCERTPIFRNIRLSGITGDAKIAGDLTGLTEMPLEGVSFTDIALDTSTGFTITDAKDIHFHNVTVNAAKGPIVVADKTESLELDAVTTTKPDSKFPVIELRDVKNVFVHGCSAPPGVSNFVSVPEKCAGELVLEANSFKGLQQPVLRVAER